MWTDAPPADIVEVVVSSRGYGESIIIHVGDNRWIVIDSHRDEHGVPIAISYLRSIGVNPAVAVRAILLTHWHDDHIDGASDMVRESRNATIALSGLLQRDEFASLLIVRGAPEAGTFGTGVDELTAVLQTAMATGQRRKWCFSEKTIDCDYGEASYSLDALSPSDKDFGDFVLAIAEVAAGGGRLSAPRRNDSSVASVLNICGDLLLFGADLEIGRSGAGWRAVHETVWQARGKASLFKVAHHGSAGADFEPVWLDMLTADVVAVLTPWNRGRKLPTQADVDRITSRAGSSFAAAKPKTSKRPKRSNTVMRSLREANIKLHDADPAQGMVRFRKSQEGKGWSVELDGAACELSRVLTA